LIFGDVKAVSKLGSLSLLPIWNALFVNIAINKTVVAPTNRSAKPKICNI
jgi:hypothetical protein